MLQRHAQIVLETAVGEAGKGDEYERAQRVYLVP